MVNSQSRASIDPNICIHVHICVHSVLFVYCHTTFEKKKHFVILKDEREITLF